MAKDPICGMFVEEKQNSIRHSVDGMEYFFCSSLCLKEFIQSEKEHKKLKRKVAISALLTVPIILLSYFTIFTPHIDHYIMLALASPVQFWIGWRFYGGMGME